MMRSNGLLFSRSLVLAITVALMLLCGLGCGCKYPGEPQPYSVAITLDPAIASRNLDVVVDLVGVNVAETPTWSNMSMTNYFAHPESFRNGAVRKTLEFRPGSDPVKAFRPNDPEWNEIWKQWKAKGARNLFVLLNMPERFDDAAGDLDPRRRMMPLGSCAYDKKDIVTNDTLRLSVTPRGLVVDTPYKSPDER